MAAYCSLTLNESLKLPQTLFQHTHIIIILSFPRTIRTLDQREISCPPLRSNRLFCQTRSLLSPVLFRSPLQTCSVCLITPFPSNTYRSPRTSEFPSRKTIQVPTNFPISKKAYVMTRDRALWDIQDILRKCQNSQVRSPELNSSRARLQHHSRPSSFSPPTFSLKYTN